MTTPNEHSILLRWFPLWTSLYVSFGISFFRLIWDEIGAGQGNLFFCDVVRLEGDVLVYGGEDYRSQGMGPTCFEAKSVQWTQIKYSDEQGSLFWLPRALARMGLMSTNISMFVAMLWPMMPFAGQWAT